jgi:ribulose-5-phosphate 4-epimerase/fuculose-1-phosphate aldolase
MARHGTVAAGKDLQAAVYAAEELEETAKLFMLLKNCSYHALNDQEVAELKERFGI